MRKIGRMNLRSWSTMTGVCLRQHLVPWECVSELRKKRSTSAADLLPTLQRRAEHSVREACREGTSFSSTTTSPICTIGLDSMCRGNMDDESKLVPTSKPVPNNPVGRNWEEGFRWRSAVKPTVMLERCVRKHF